MAVRSWGNEYRTTLVCVDAYENGAISGRFYNPDINTGQEFASLMEFLKAMDRTLDVMNFPQSFTAARTFAPAPTAPSEAADPGSRTGRIATFAVKILFRQNASWQGTVIWMEEGREESFRSALELIFLMDSALSQTIEKRKQTTLREE